MAEIDFYYPFDSIEGDRKTVAATERRFWGALFTDGVVGSDAFAVTTPAEGSYTIGEGVAIIGGAVGGIVTPKTVTATPAAGAKVYIVLRLDTTSAARKITLEVVSSLATATAAQLYAGGQLDLPLYSVEGRTGGGYGLLDQRAYCTSFDAEQFAPLFDMFLASADSRASGLLAAMQQQFDAEISSIKAETAGLYGSAGRQGFINPIFQVNQRGTARYSLSSGTTYTFDRWLCRIGGASTSAPVVVSRVQDGDRLALQVENKAYAAGSTAAASCIAQNIEGGVRQFCSDGKRFTVSFDAKASAPQVLAVEPVQFMQEGGSGVAISAKTVNVTTDWSRYTLTFTGTETPTADQIDDVLKVGFFFAWKGYSGRFGADQDAENMVYLANMQINEGTSALPCYVRDYGEELERCRRYYVALGFTSLSCGAVNATTKQVVSSPIPLTRAMRAQPSVTVTDRANVAGVASAEVASGSWRNGLACEASASAADLPVLIVTNTDTSDVTRIALNSVRLDAELTD